MEKGMSSCGANYIPDNNGCCSIVVIVCKLIMLNGNCCNKFLYIYRTARYLCSSVRFTPETFVSGVFLLSKKIVIQQYLSRFGFTCPSRGTMVWYSAWCFSMESRTCSM